MKKQNHNRRLAESATKLFEQGYNLNEIVKIMNEHGLKNWSGNSLTRNELQGIIGYYKEWLPQAIRREKLLPPAPPKRYEITREDEPHYRWLIWSIAIVYIVIGSIIGYYFF